MANILVGSDHAGFALKELVKKRLAVLGFEAEDVGCFSEASCDYPIFARDLCEKIQQNVDSQGMVLFSQLLNGDRTPTTVLDVFIPVLFLTNQQKILAWQDDWMGEIFISLNAVEPTA